MGGGRRFEYPKWVWTPAGGWWANPKNWKANTAAYLLFSAGVGFVVYKFTQPKIVSRNNFIVNRMEFNLYYL